MKAKQKVILSVGLVLGGVAMAQGVSALTYQSGVLEEFTWNSDLRMSVSADSIAISNLVPGQASRSDSDLSVTVSTSNVTGYVLSASVGNASNASTELRLGGTDTANKFSMVSASTTLTGMTAGQWGYTTATDNSATYSGLAYNSDTTIDSNATNGQKVTTFAIGAKATDSQATGDYTNVINFKAVTNVVTTSVNMTADTGITGITMDGTNGTSSVAAKTYAPGTVINISATPSSGGCYWTMSESFGTIADASSCSTTYTVGSGNVTLTAHRKDS